MRRQGFTLVEVLVSLGVMTIGAMALIGMQQQTARANIRARDMTVAMQIAQNVIERVKIDGSAWTTISGNRATDLANAPLLKPIENAIPGVFRDLTFTPPILNGETRVLSNAYDYAGDDVDLTGADAKAAATRVRFCASYRLAWIYTNQRAMRVDTRVWWSKEAPTRTITSDFVNCADDDKSLNPGGAYYNAYHVVYLSTVIRPNGT